MPNNNFKIIEVDFFSQSLLSNYSQNPENDPRAIRPPQLVPPSRAGYEWAQRALGLSQAQCEQFRAEVLEAGEFHADPADEDLQKTTTRDICQTELQRIVPSASLTFNSSSYLKIGGQHILGMWVYMDRDYKFALRFEHPHGGQNYYYDGFAIVRARYRPIA